MQIALRGSKFFFPTTCCCCLTQTSNTKDISRVSVNTDGAYRTTTTTTIAVPLCAECCEHEKRIRLPVLLVPTVIWAILWFVSLFVARNLNYIPNEDLGAFIFFMAVGGIIASIVAIITLIVYNLIFKNVWRKQNPGHTSPMWNCRLMGSNAIKFANDRYGEMFVEANAGRVNVVKEMLF